MQWAKTHPTGSTRSNYKPRYGSDTSQEVAHRNLRHKCIRREAIGFSVLAPANLVLIGELILISLYEHISDRARLEILNEVAARYRDLRTPVNEKLQLYIMEANQ